jgi:hypothetical protein
MLGLRERAKRALPHVDACWTSTSKAALRGAGTPRGRGRSCPSVLAVTWTCVQGVLFRSPRGCQAAGRLARRSRSIPVDIGPATLHPKVRDGYLIWNQIPSFAAPPNDSHSDPRGEGTCRAQCVDYELPGGIGWNLRRPKGFARQPGEADVQRVHLVVDCVYLLDPPRGTALARHLKSDGLTTAINCRH